MSTVTVAITTIPGREDKLEDAMGSVMSQTREPDDVVVVVDRMRRGAALARNRALEMVGTRFVAWLDDDDLFRPEHVEVLMDHARYRDVVYTAPRMVVDGSAHDMLGTWPWNQRFTKAMRHTLAWKRNFIPVNCLMRASRVRKAGGFPVPGSDEWPFDNGEDWGLMRKLAKDKARFRFVGRTTWDWRQWDGQTKGQGFEE